MITCSKCRNYSFGLRRCLLSKANPNTKKGTKEAMKIMGPTYVCEHNKWRQVIFNEMVLEAHLG